MNDRLCVCSLDTVVLVGDIRSLDEFNELLELHSSPSSIGLFQLRLYERNIYASDGTKISAGYKGGNPRRVRLEISPSKANLRIVATLLCHLENIRIQRCDVALDYIGFDIQEYEFHCSNLGLAHHRLSRNPFPHSYVYGEGDSHRRIAIYDKLEKARSERVRAIRIVDVHGIAYEVSPARLQSDGVGWFRIEARLKGHWILDGIAPRTNIFSDFLAKERTASTFGNDLRTEATLDYISRHPEAIRRLGRHSRAKYRKYMRALSVDHLLTPDPRDVYRDNYLAICDALEALRSLGSGPASPASETDGRGLNG